MIEHTLISSIKRVKVRECQKVSVSSLPQYKINIINYVDSHHDIVNINYQRNLLSSLCP